MAQKRNNSVRIIGGEYRRRLLHFPDQTGLRPTPDRVRETLFNWLGQRLQGLSCLDAFAGSGALGFEAASRGASRVLMLERDARAAEALRGNAGELGITGVEIRQQEALAYLQNCSERFDLIFLDPPFASDLLAPALRLAAACLSPEGRIYAEAALEPAAENLIIVRRGRAGHSHYCLMEHA